MKKDENSKINEDLDQKLLDQETALKAQFEIEKKQIIKETNKKAKKAAVKIVLEKTRKILEDEITITDEEEEEHKYSPASPSPRRKRRNSPVIKERKIQKQTIKTRLDSSVKIISVETPKSLNVLSLPSALDGDKEVYTIVDGFKSENPQSDNDIENDEMIYYDEVDTDQEAMDEDRKDEDHLMILGYSNESAAEDDKGELKIFKCNFCDQGFTRLVFLVFSD